MIEPGVVLIAIGGNALVHEGESGALCRQQERSAAFARQVVEPEQKIHAASTAQRTYRRSR